MPIFSRFLLVLAFLPATLAMAQNSPYSGCSKLVQKNPQAALRMAEEWLQKTPDPSAHHCRAMALFSLKRYEQAAGALQMLEQALRTGNPILWGNVVRQQARSWVLAGDKARAIVTLSQSVHRIADKALEDPKLGRLCAELLLQRSQLYTSVKRDLLALQDLDQALSLSPKNPQLLMQRATLFLQQNEPALARSDLDTLETLHPNYPGAMALRSQLR